MQQSAFPLCTAARSVTVLLMSGFVLSVTQRDAACFCKGWQFLFALLIQFKNIGH